MATKPDTTPHSICPDCGEPHHCTRSPVFLSLIGDKVATKPDTLAERARKYCETQWPQAPGRILEMVGFHRSETGRLVRGIREQADGLVRGTFPDANNVYAAKALRELAERIEKERD